MTGKTLRVEAGADAWAKKIAEPGCSGISVQYLEARSPQRHDRRRIGESSDDEYAKAVRHDG
ncbi:hypothetical protein [Burkholderia ubonensis]|nr:hypothetical protein [Burkholderia ubonensis]